MDLCGLVASPMRRRGFRPEAQRLSCSARCQARRNGLGQTRRTTMTAATFHTRTAIPGSRTERQPGFFARLFDAMAEVRMRQAVRELAMHRHLVPEDLLKKYGYRATLRDDSRLPFTR